MWHWEQGRMEYFQYDVLRRLAHFIVNYKWERDDSKLIRQVTGLEFAAPKTHSPWRNYFRVIKLAMLASEQNGIAVPTSVAIALSQAGATTCDEYFHFIVQATSDPSPALSEWDTHIANNEQVRHPLCFALKYLLANAMVVQEFRTSITEIINAYISSGYDGSEDASAFSQLVQQRQSFLDAKLEVSTRQARESIKCISQISYLYCDRNYITVALSPEECSTMFRSIDPLPGSREQDGNAEIQRLATLFGDGSGYDILQSTTPRLLEIPGSGFAEGTRIQRSHLATERSSKLREVYFGKNPTAVCDACLLDTQKKYPWVKRVLDIHHVLPLASGVRVELGGGTVLDDLVPVCPTCHRAVHRYYDSHLAANGRGDFIDDTESRSVYAKAKEAIASGDCYV